MIKKINGDVLDAPTDVVEIIENLLATANALPLRQRQRQSILSYLNKNLDPPQRLKGRPSRIETKKEMMRDPIILAICRLLSTEPNSSKNNAVNIISALPEIRKLSLTHGAVRARVRSAWALCKDLLIQADTKAPSPGENSVSREDGRIMVRLVWKEGRITGYSDVS